MAALTSSDSELSEDDIKRSCHYCPHCDCNVTRSTFYRHKAEYYDPSKDMWTTSTDKTYYDSDGGSSSTEDSFDWERHG